MRGLGRQAQNCGNAPSPGLLRNPTSPRAAGRGKKSKIVLATRLRPRFAAQLTFARPRDPPALAQRASAGLSPPKRTSAKAESGDPDWIPACAGMSDCFSHDHETKREAERRKAHAVHCPRHIPECRHPKMPGAEAHPKRDALACRRFAAALATGCDPDGSAPEPGFPRRWLAGVLPASPKRYRG